MTNLLSVGLGGFLGAILRALTGIFISKFPTLLFFPFATLLVNVIGSFLIGIFLTLPLITSNPNLKSFLTAGLLGGLTTFSTFSFDTLTLIENQRFIAAGLNLFLNIVTALIFCYLGTLVSKLLMAN
ncbi:MAG: fluoride efflux transporter CrcB [Aeromonadales bacterium]|nr:fluoride efflux transporter CrcB [Aeromonadales bacterium]